MARIVEFILERIQKLQFVAEKAESLAKDLVYCHSGEVHIMTEARSDEVSWEEHLPTIVAYALREVINDKRPSKLVKDHSMGCYIDSIEKR